MKKIFFAVLLVPGICFASDPCEDSNHDARDNWVLTLNRNDDGLKKGLVTSLKLLGNKGFSVVGIGSDHGELELRVEFQFDISAYSDSALGLLQGMRIRDMVINRLQAINANLLECRD